MSHPIPSCSPPMHSSTPPPSYPLDQGPMPIHPDAAYLASACRPGLRSVNAIRLRQHPAAGGDLRHHVHRCPPALPQLAPPAPGEGGAGEARQRKPAGATCARAAGQVATATQKRSRPKAASHSQRVLVIFAPRACRPPGRAHRGDGQRLLRACASRRPARKGHRNSPSPPGWRAPAAGSPPFSSRSVFSPCPSLSLSSCLCDCSAGSIGAARSAPCQRAAPGQVSDI